MILQVGEQEPWAQHLICALGAISKSSSFQWASKQVSSSPEKHRKLAETHYKFALSQYGKALGLMKGIVLPETSKDTHLRNVMISCLLTTCFEAYIGQKENAAAQAASGSNVLHASNTQAVSKYPTSFLEEDLVDTFARLDMQVVKFNKVPKRVYPFYAVCAARLAKMAFVVLYGQGGKIVLGAAVEKCTRQRNCG